MKCPYCGNRMSKGLIQCRDGVYRNEKIRPLVVLPLGGGKRIRLSDDSFEMFGGHAVEAHYCENCKKIVIDVK
ncbi:MAG: hypothetical protein IKX58_07185 [Clostridia bacterium]|nr:hypothetical protein [Clostridia bacterium]